VVLGPGEGRAYPTGRISAVFKADSAETGQLYSIAPAKSIVVTNRLDDDAV
jgi:hypothetical protein